ncbi:hypothetical protein [Cellulomonas sp.]|uniref:hypothetical protein n=1 Tax=Cellulomonas sp. TaxID=40001 RepID=UPI0025882633|nr:hypothetical protein [Cellulomonas sp.]MCR6690171.1 hypothetical protein [Cellulomonas sp.]
MSSRRNALVLAVVRSPAHRVLGRVRELRYTGPRSGADVRLPVEMVEHGDALVVLVGRAATKRWWRAFREPWPVVVTTGRRERHGIGQVLTADDPRRAAAAAAYQAVSPARVGPDDVLVLITPG